MVFQTMATTTTTGDNATGTPRSPMVFHLVTGAPSKPSSNEFRFAPLACDAASYTARHQRRSRSRSYEAYKQVILEGGGPNECTLARKLASGLPLGVGLFVLFCLCSSTRPAPTRRW